jgi:hypothetical protein
LQARIYFRINLLVTLIVLALLTACAVRFPRQNIDPAKNNQATYRSDLAQCQEDYPELSSGVHYPQWIGCMNLKGWK